MTADFRKIPLFAGVEEESLRALSARTVVMSFPANTPIFREGDLPDALYVVISGRVKVYLNDEDGKQLVLSTRGPGDYFGEMMLDDKPRSATVVTEEACEFAVMSREVFTTFLLEHPKVALQIIRDLIRVGRGMNVRTRESFRQHIEALESRKVEELAAVRRWRMAKSIMLAAVLLFAGVQFIYFRSH
jgi:CRP/FNR family cyclic AMP-dependent transcriptional regulator